MQVNQTPRFIRAKEGAARFGVSVGTWWNWNNPKNRPKRAQMAIGIDWLG